MRSSTHPRIAPVNTRSGSASDIQLRLSRAGIMSLGHSARLNGHEPHAYLRDLLERLPTQPASRIAELLPHRWHSIHSEYLAGPMAGPQVLPGADSRLS